MAHPTFTFITPSAAPVESPSRARTSRSSRPGSRLSTDAISTNTFMVSSASSSAQPSPCAPYGDARATEWYNRPAGMASTAAPMQLPRSTALAAASAAAAAASAGISVSPTTGSPCSNRSGSAEARAPVLVEVPVSMAPSTASADAAAAAATPPSPPVVAAAGTSPRVALHRAPQLGLSPHQTHTHPQHPAHLLHATPLCSEASLQSQSTGSSSATAHATTSSTTRGSRGGGATATIYKRPPSFVRRSSSGSGTAPVHHVQPSPTSSESLKLQSPTAPAVMKSPPRTVSAAATAPPPPTTTQSQPQLSKLQVGPARTSPRAAGAIHTAAGPAGAQQTRLGTPLPPPISTLSGAHTPSMSVRQYSSALLESPKASPPASDLSNTAEGVDWSWADTDPREVWRQRVELNRARTPAPPLSPRPPPQQQQQQSWLAPQQLQPTSSADDVDARSSSARPSEASVSLQLPLAAVLAASVKSTPPQDEVSSATPSSYAPSAPAPPPPPAHAAALDETDDMGDDEEESALTDMNIFVAVRVRPLNAVLAREAAAAAAASAAATIDHTDDESALRPLFSQQHLRAEDSCELADAECEMSRTAFSVLSESPTRPRARPGSSSSAAAPRARNGSQVRPQRSQNGSHVAVEGDADGLAAAKGQHRCIQADARNGFVDCTVGISGNTLASSCGSSTASAAAALSNTSITSDALLSGRRVTTRRFYYDHILDETVTQADVMARIGRRAVRRVLQGYHGTVMCYGQSGSGKTYTTVGPHGGKLSRRALEWMTSAGPMADGSTAAKHDEVDDGDEHHAGEAGGAHAHVRAAAASMGLLPRMLVALFHGLEARHPTSARAAPPTSTWRMTISALELYNEDLRDLLPHDTHLKRTGADEDAGRRGHRHNHQQRRHRHRSSSSSSSSSNSGSDDDGRLEQEADGDRAATPSPEPVDSAAGARGKRASASTKAPSRRGADHRGALNAASDAHDETSSDSGTRLHHSSGDQEVHHDPHDAVPTLSRQTVNGVETASECNESLVRRDRSESPAPQPGNTPMRTRVSQRVGNGGLSSKRGSSIAVPGGAASGATALPRRSSKSPTPRARGASAANMWAAPPSSAATPVVSLQIRQTAAPASAVAPSAAAAGGDHGGRGGSPRPTAAASGGARRQAGTEAVYIDGLREHEVRDVHEAMELVRQALRHRQMGSTKLNKDSSRSHTFFFVRVEQQWQRTSAADGAGGAADAAAAATTTRCCDIRRSTLTLVDLAGSERVSHTGAHGLRLKEAQNINLSLSALGNVMRLLSAAAAAAGGAMSASNTSTAATPHGATAAADVHVPYRDSKLTRILQSSLGGNAITFLLCNASPERRDALETMSTLRFAKLAKTVKNRVHRNETTTADALTEALAAARAEAAASATERHAILLAVAAAQAKIHELVTDGTQARDRLRQLATYAWWLEGHLSHFAAAAYEQQQQQHRQHQQQGRRDEYDDGDAGRATWRSSTTTVASVAVTTPGRARGDAMSRGLVLPGEAAAPQVLFTEDCLSARRGLAGSQLLMPRFTDVCDSVPRDEPRSVSESDGPAAPEWWCVSPRPPSPSAAAHGDAPHAAADAAAARAYWHSAPARAFLSSAHSIVERRQELQRRLIAAAAAVSASPSTAIPFASTVGQQQQQVPSADRVMTPGRWSDVRQRHPATAAGATSASTALALPIAITEVPPSPSAAATPAAAAAATSVATNPLDGAPHSPNGSISCGRREAGDSACDPDANDVTVAAVDSGVCSGHAPSSPLRGDNGARRGRGSLASMQGSAAVVCVSDLSPSGSTRSRRASDTTQDGEQSGTPGDALDQRGGENAENSLCAVATLSSAPLLFGSPRQDAPTRLYPPGLDAAAALADERSAHAASQARLQQLEEVNVLLRLRLAEMQRRLREGGGSTDAGGADAKEAAPHAASCATPPTAPALWPPHYTRAASDASLEAFLARCGFAPLQTEASTTTSAAAAPSPSRAAAAREQALHLLPVSIRRRRNSSSLTRISVDPSSMAALRRGSGGQQPTWTGSEDYNNNASNSGFAFNAASSGAFAGSRIDAGTGMTPSPTASSVRSRSRRTRSSISSARSGSNSNSCSRSANRECKAVNKTSRVIKPRKPRLPPPVPLVIVDDLPPSTLSSARAEAYTDVARAIAAAAAALRGSAQGGGASSFEDDGDHLSLAYRSPNTMDQLSHSIYSVGGGSSLSGGSDSATGRRRWGAHLLDTLRATLALVRAFRKREDFLELEDLSSFSIE